VLICFAKSEPWYGMLWYAFDVINVKQKFFVLNVHHTCADDKNDKRE